MVNEPMYDLMYMGMQLDNEGGFRDLDMYNDIKRLITKSEPDGDNILTLTYARYNDFPHKLYYNVYELSSDKQLKALSQKLPPEQFKEYENTTMIIYTFLAQLTKRIRNQYVPSADANGIALVMSRFLSTTMNYIKNT